MARETGRAVTGAQVVAMLAAIGIPEAELPSIREITVEPHTVQVVRTVRGDSGGSLVGADGRIAEYVERIPIDWRAT
jgi:hypothetical protein